MFFLKQGEDIPHRAASCPRTLLTQVHGYSTVPELLRKSIEDNANKQSYGVRELVKMTKQDRPVVVKGKTFTKQLDIPYLKDFAFHTYAEVGSLRPCPCFLFSYTLLLPFPPSPPFATQWLSVYVCVFISLLSLLFFVCVRLMYVCPLCSWETRSSAWAVLWLNSDSNPETVSPCTYLSLYAPLSLDHLSQCAPIVCMLLGLPQNVCVSCGVSF